MKSGSLKLQEPSRPVQGLPDLGRPTSSLDYRLLLQKVDQRRRVFSLQYMYRITLQNVLLSNKYKYSFRHPQYCSYSIWNLRSNFHCPSVWPHGTTGIPPDELPLQCTCEYCSEKCLENSVFNKNLQQQSALYTRTTTTVCILHTEHNNSLHFTHGPQQQSALYTRTATHFWSNLAQFFLE